MMAVVHNDKEIYILQSQNALCTKGSGYSGQGLWLPKPSRVWLWEPEALNVEHMDRSGSSVRKLEKYESVTYTTRWLFG